MNEKILAFGEILLRLSAADETIRDSRSFFACYGGTESNVLACLASLGHHTEYLTALPDNDLGKAALAHLNRLGVDTSHVLTDGDTMGMYFTENGTASRGANVVYARRHSAFTHLDENSFPFDSVFDGVKLFHISGISFALSESSCALAFRLIDEAKKRHIPVSFDFNFRPALWTAEKALPKLRRAALQADILLASHRDLDTFMATDEENVFDAYPCKYLVLRDRTVISSDKHSVSVTLINRDGTKTAIRDFSFPVTDKIGGGDAFDGALLHGLLCGRMSDAESLRFATAAFALKHTVPGDVLSVTENEIIQFMNKTEGLLP